MAQATLRPVFSVRFALEEAVPTFSTQDGSNILVKVNNGESKTLDSKFPFEVEFAHGHDNIFTSHSPNYSHLDCKVYGKTKRTGAPLVFNYTGVMCVEGVAADILADKHDDMDYKDGYVTANIVIDVDKAAEDEIGWVHRYNLVGRGKFSRDANRKLFIDYVVHIVE